MRNPSALSSADRPSITQAKRCQLTVISFSFRLDSDQSLYEAFEVKRYFTAFFTFFSEDNGWALSLIYPVIIDFDKTLIKYPNITRYVGGASTDLIPNLQHPDNPVPLLKEQIDRLHIGGGGG